MGRIIWTKEVISQELKKIEANGEPLNSKYMEKNHRKVWDGSFRQFGNWKNTIEQVFGYDYEKQVLSYVRWSKEKLIKELLTVKENGEPINVVYMIAHHYKIVDMANNHFGSYPKLVEAAGINYNDVRIDHDGSRAFGIKFENLVRNMFNILNLRYKYHASYDGCIPDFSDPDIGLWLDAKLTGWTLSLPDKEKQLRRYMQKCNNLIIIYLKGEPPKYLENKYPKLDFMVIDKYYPQLKSIDRVDIINSFIRLKSDVRKFEKKQAPGPGVSLSSSFPKVDLTGKRFNRLTVVEYVGRKNGEPYWKCICDCGNEHITRHQSLKKGHVSSCGCISAEKRIAHNASMIGKRFGRLKVIEHVGKEGRYEKFKCVCDCGNIIITERNRLKNGTTKSCGCFQRERARECNLGNIHRKH